MKTPSNLSRREWLFVLCIAMLTQFLIQAAAWLYSGNGSALSYVAFAGTLVSIVLALLAIIYTYYSNSSQQQLSTSLATASSTVANSAERIGAATIVLEEKLACVPTLLEEFGGKMDSTHVLVKALSARERAAAAPRVEEPSTGPPQGLNTYFAKTSSLLGLMATYAFGLAFKHSMGFDLKKFCSESEFLDYYYSFGYVVAAQSLRFFCFTVSGTVYTVSEYPDDLFDAVQQGLKNRLDTQEDASSKEAMQQCIKALHSHFNMPETTL